jgi:hypothetical protein
MRPKFLVGVVVGLLLVYLSFFGISGFGLLLSGTPENFTTYTKVDPGGYVSVTSLTATVTAMPRSAVAYVYKNFGAGHFGDFELQFESQLSAVQPGAGLFILILANNVGASSQMADTAIGVSSSYDGTTYKFVLGDGRVSYTFCVIPNPFVLYYFDLSRTGSLTTLSIYASSTYTNPVATLTCTIGDKFQYLYVAQSAGVAGDMPTVSGKVQNLIIAGGSTPTYSDVTISVSGQGTTSPPARHYATTYYVGGSLTITATPASGWAFDYMTRNGVTTASMTLTSLGASEQVVVYFKTGPATTGTLRVSATYNGAYVVASITASGPQTVYGSTTTSSANPLAFTVTAGTYTVSGTYSSGSASPVTVTVPAGGSADASLNFGGSPPTPDFIVMIKAFFDLLVVKSLFLVSGLASTIGCGIMFMLPSKGGRSRQPAYYSPY